ncbi:hypothetical protein BHE74_00023301 [Ensete ventricosum]|nr:hypothetical protein BHE74_00023301 [Ensete ventricosum]
MDMFEAANPTAKSLGDSTQMEPEEQAVSTCTEAEIYFPIHLEPPSLLKIRNCKKSAKRKFKPRINLLQAKAPLSAARALPTAGQFHQMHVVLRELRLPDEVRRGSAPERPAEPRRTADLQRIEVEQHRGDAALRQVPEPRLVGPRLPIRPRDARRPGAHRQHQAAESELAKGDPIRGKQKKKKIRVLETRNKDEAFGAGSGSIKTAKGGGGYRGKLDWAAREERRTRWGAEAKYKGAMTGQTK